MDRAGSLEVVKEAVVKVVVDEDEDVGVMLRLGVGEVYGCCVGVTAAIVLTFPEEGSERGRESEREGGGGRVRGGGRRVACGMRALSSLKRNCFVLLALVAARVETPLSLLKDTTTTASQLGYFTATDIARCAPLDPVSFTF